MIENEITFSSIDRNKTIRPRMLVQGLLDEDLEEFQLKLGRCDKINLISLDRRIKSGMEL